MDRSAFTDPQRPLVPSTRPNARQFLTQLHRCLLQHPALSHPAEDDSVQHSLDLSFQHAVSISTLDRQIIDKLGQAQSVLIGSF